jgi:hypothetical protein
VLNVIRNRFSFIVHNRIQKGRDIGIDIGGETFKRWMERDRETEGKRQRGKREEIKQRGESEGKRQEGRI